ncbi:MAG: Spore germination protein [Desulfotomaculum sp. 46_296]|nr:MAG: Spore germination protein [Desulfotomaculum sp. 46_296]HAU31176.1 hypothetical protein [Desulfotomaculum sp.]
MIKDEKIDNRQALSLLVINFISEGLLLAPGVTFLLARQDAWISNIVALAGGLFSAWCWVSLTSRFPGKTLFEVFLIIFGRYFGTIMAIYYAWGWFNFASDTTREITSLLVSGLMPRTPLVAFIILFSVTSTFIAYHRLECIARISVIFLPFILFIIILLSLLSTREFDLTNLTPVFEKGLLPIFKGSLAPMFWFSQVIEISVLLPFLNQPKEALRTSSKGILLSFFIFELVAFVTMAILGPDLAAHTLAPVLYGARMIHLAGFFERLEVLIMVIWIASSILKITLYHWTVSLGAAQLIGLDDYRSLIIPIGIFLACFSFFLHPNIPHLYNFMGFVWGGPHGLGYLTLGPFLFLLWAVITGKGGKP